MNRITSAHLVNLQQIHHLVDNTHIPKNINTEFFTLFSRYDWLNLRLKMEITQRFSLFIVIMQLLTDIHFITKQQKKVLNATHTHFPSQSNTYNSKAICYVVINIRILLSHDEINLKIQSSHTFTVNSLEYVDHPEKCANKETLFFFCWSLLLLLMNRESRVNGL